MTQLLPVQRRQRGLALRTSSEQAVRAEDSPRSQRRVHPQQGHSCGTDLGWDRGAHTLRGKQAARILQVQMPLSIPGGEPEPGPRTGLAPGSLNLSGLLC